MRRKPLVIAGAALFVLVLVALFFPKMHYVDQRPAVAVGEEYFSKLKQGQVDDALAMYTKGFLQKVVRSGANSLPTSIPKIEA